MKAPLKIAYEPHPVTPERKAELRAQGFRIIDVRFKPQELIEAEKKATKRRRAKSAGQNGSEA